MGSKKKAAADKQAALLKIRKAVQQGYSAVMGGNYSRTALALGITDLAQRHIDDITKDQSSLRPSKLTQVKQIKENVKSAVVAAKKMDPDTFTLKEGEKRKAADTNVNTEEGSEMGNDSQGVPLTKPTTAEDLGI